MGTAMAAISLRSKPAAITLLMVTARRVRKNLVPLGGQLAENTLGSGQCLPSKFFFQQRDALAVDGAAENRFVSGALTVQVQQQAAGPFLPHLRDRLPKPVMISVVIEFGLDTFIRHGSRPVGVGKFPFKRRHDKKRLATQARAELAGHRFGELGRIAVPFDVELGNTDSAARHDSRNRLSPAVRRRKNDRQGARPNRQQAVSAGRVLSENDLIERQSGDETEYLQRKSANQ